MISPTDRPIARASGGRHVLYAPRDHEVVVVSECGGDYLYRRDSDDELIGLHLNPGTPTIVDVDAAEALTKAGVEIASDTPVGDLPARVWLMGRAPRYQRPRREGVS